MKAVVLKGNKKLSIINKKLNDLDNNYCRIKIENTGVCSSDIQRSYDKGAYFYPLIMGHEMAGRITDIGKDIKNYCIGDRITIFPLLPCFNCLSCDSKMYARCDDYSYFGSREDGGYAEYLDVPEWNLMKLPDDVSFEDAALIEPLSVVVHGLKRINLIKSNKKNTPGSTVIIGAGFLGLLAVQILRKQYPDIDLSIIDRNSFKLDIADKYVNNTIKLDTINQWSNLSSKYSFQNVIEATGDPVAFKHTISLAMNGGNILWMGNITGSLTFSKDLISMILRKELSILGTWNSKYKSQKPDDWKQSINLIQSGIRPSELITHRITLDDLPNTLKDLYYHKQGKKSFNSVKIIVNN